MTTWRVFLAVGLTALFVQVSVAPAGAAEALEFDATVDGRDVAGAGSSDAVVIDPATTQQFVLSVTNPTDEPVTVRRVRLAGDIGGLTIVAYDITADLEVDGGTTEVLDLPVEFIGLEEQAEGLLPGGLVLYDENRDVVATKDFVIDVKGNTTSVMGLFAIFLALGTAIGLAVLGRRVYQRTLVGNRLRRALQFGAVGLGFGAALVLWLAVLRFTAPTAAVWLPLLIIATGGLALLGFLSPGPLDFEPDEIDQALAEAGAEPSAVG